MDHIYEPTDSERSELSQVLGMPGFKVIKKIAEASCAEFDLRLKNLDPETCRNGPKDYDTLVLEYHRQSKVAAMTVQRIFDLIEKEMNILEAPKPEKVRGDITEDAFEEPSAGERVFEQIEEEIGIGGI